MPIQIESGPLLDAKSHDQRGSVIEREHHVQAPCVQIRAIDQAR
jgi:hypothetical protein